jgi:hypothetical protein
MTVVLIIVALAGVAAIGYGVYVLHRFGEL